jgi:hypothetical protein
MDFVMVIYIKSLSQSIFECKFCSILTIISIYCKKYAKKYGARLEVQKNPVLRVSSDPGFMDLPACNAAGLNHLAQLG